MALLKKTLHSFLHWSEHSDAMLLALKQGQLSEAVHHAQSALDLVQRDPGASPLNRAILGTNLAVALSHTEQVDRTVQAFVNGWKAFGREFYLTDEALDHVRAFVHYLSARELWQLAENYLIPSLDIARKIQQKFPESYLRTLKTAAYVYQSNHSPLLQGVMAEARVFVDAQSNPEEHFEKALDLGRYWEELGMFHAALELLESLHRETESKPEFQAKRSYTLGNVYYEMGELEKAESEYLKALALFKKHSALCDASAISALNNYALLLTRLDKWAASKSVLQQSLALIPAIDEEIAFTHRTVLVNLSHVSAFLGDLSAAIDYLKGALAITHGFGTEVLEQKADLCDRLTLLYERTQDYAALVEIAKEGKAYLKELRANAIYGESAFLARAANACFEMGQNQDALDFYQMALLQVEGDRSSSQEDYKIAFGNLGMAYERLEDWENAKKYYLLAFDKIGTGPKWEDRAIYGLHLAKSKFYTGGARDILEDLAKIQSWLERMDACPLWLQLELRELGALALREMGSKTQSIVHVMDRNLEEINESVDGESKFPYLLHQLNVSLGLGITQWSRNLCAELEKEFPKLCAQSEEFLDFKARLA